MANTKSAIKRIRRISKQTTVNKARKNRFRGALKKMNSLINDKKKVTNNDLQYYNQSFENIFLDKSFLEIFNRKKVRDFLLEIS